MAQLETEVAALKKSSEAPKPKDGWDKLQSLSTLLSGVIIAAIGIWLNHSLVTSQERAQTAQVTATQEIERSHNGIQERQQEEALALQEQQAKDNLKLEVARRKSQEQQAAASLQSQREQNRAALDLQKSQNDANLAIAQAQTEEKFFLHLQSGTKAEQIATLRMMTKIDPQGAVEFAHLYLVTSLDTSLKQAAKEYLVSLQENVSLDPSIRQLAKDALVQVAVETRIQQISEVLRNGTGEAQYDYISKSLLHLAYGREGAQLDGGDLYSLISSYCALPQALEAEGLRPYLDRLRRQDLSLASDETFTTLLEKASSDRVMQQAQDDQFKQTFWMPAVEFARTVGLKLPLSLAIIYDTNRNIGKRGVAKIIESTNAAAGGTPLEGVDEKVWSAKFLEKWRAWINIKSMIADYMMPQVAFLEYLMRANNWDLNPPVEILGKTIN